VDPASSLLQGDVGAQTARLLMWRLPMHPPLLSMIIPRHRWLKRRFHRLFHTLVFLHTRRQILTRFSAQVTCSTLAHGTAVLIPGWCCLVGIIK
jgi:hypothetical protein